MPTEQQCADCKGTFTIVKRKHSCRKCGAAFCGQCSSTYSVGGTRKERSCIQCASKDLLLRRKAKPVKKLGKVVKAAKCDKFEAWENITEDAQLTTKVTDEVKKTPSCDTTAAPSRIIEDADENVIPNQGMLCILPPSLYSMIFGE